MKTAIRVIISVCLIGVIIWMLGGLGEVVLQIQRINPLYIVPIVALIIVDRGIMTFKWGLLLRGRGLRLPFHRGMMIYCASAVWGTFVPTPVSSDAIRAYTTSRIGLDAREVISSIIVERLLGFLSALLLGILSLGLLTSLGYLRDQATFAWLLGGGMLLGAILLLAVSVNQRAFSLFHDRILHGFSHLRLARKLREFHETYRLFFVNRTILAIFLYLTLGEQLLPIVEIWLIVKGMGIEVGLLYLAAVLPVALLISRIPISFEGIGVFEGAFIMLMSAVNLPAAHAVAIVIVGRVLQMASLLPWWIAFVITHGNLRMPLPPSQETHTNVR